MSRTKILSYLRVGVTLMAFCCVTLYASAESKRVDELLASFNDDDIPFNNRLIVLGKADAALSGVLVIGISEDTSFLVKAVLPGILKKYVDSGRMKLTIIEHPLTWHDMQAFAGFRCVSAEKHWELLQKVARRDERRGYEMKKATYLRAPEFIWPMMRDFDVPREKAEKCMRNNAIVGHMEGQRRLVGETWNVKNVPTFVVGDKVLANPSGGILDDAILSALKEKKP